MTTMTIDRALLEQTLQALVRTYHYGGVIAADAECITALRTALAQQQAKPQGCDHCNHPLYAATKCRVCGRVTEQAKPVQEPVAWRTFDGEGGYDYRTYEDNDSYAAEWTQRNPRHIGWVEPLYTAPPKPEPVDTDCHAQGICQRSGYGIGKQAEPLTEKEMYVVEEEARKNFRLSQAGPRGQMITYWDSLTPWLIRAVERAHGIGNKK